jgi:hypothetical protein
MNRQPCPATPTTQRLFGRIKAKPYPDHYGIVRTPYSPGFNAASADRLGIIEDFPANRDQICLIIGQDLFDPIAAEDEPDRHGHDIGVEPDIFRERRLIAVFNFPA